MCPHPNIASRLYRMKPVPEIVKQKFVFDMFAHPVNYNRIIQIQLTRQRPKLLNSGRNGAGFIELQHIGTHNIIA